MTTKPTYMQIAEYYQQRIRDGSITAGERLPSVRQIADDWGVTVVTANRGMKYLQAAQLTDTSRSGTVVREQRVTPSPQDRVRRELSNEWLSAEGVTVTEAGLVTRPYASSLLGLEDDSQVIRREQITYRQSTPIMLTVRWLPGEFAELAPELLTTQALSTIDVIRRATGRTVAQGSDAAEGRAADRREANALNVPVGSPILAGVWSWSDADGVLEYGEYVCPEGRVITYEYTVATPEHSA